MKEMGYNFFYKKNKWEGNFKSESPVLFAHLSVPDKLEYAISYLEKKLAPLLQKSVCEFNHGDISSPSLPQSGIDSLKRFIAFE